tara:strand:+ start:275 stop:457 length:183 start_codon:yes stop_codon:yes gene_type:complete
MLQQFEIISLKCLSFHCHNPVKIRLNHGKASIFGHDERNGKNDVHLNVVLGKIMLKQSRL